MSKSTKGPISKPQASEALDLFTVKRKQGKPAGGYEGVSIRMGNASYKPRGKRAMNYVAPGDGGF